MIIAGTDRSRRVQDQGLNGLAFIASSAGGLCCMVAPCLPAELQTFSALIADMPRLISFILCRRFAIGPTVHGSMRPLAFDI
jgi:hypothetical protein